MDIYAIIAGMNEKSDSSKMASLAVKSAFIFGAPAVIVGIFGPKLDNYMGTENGWTITLLATALVISWTLVIVWYKKASREIKLKKNGLT